MPPFVNMIWVSVTVNSTETKSVSGSSCGLQHELHNSQLSFIVQHLSVIACVFLCLGAACQPQAQATYKLQKGFVQPVCTITWSCTKLANRAFTSPLARRIHT